MPMRKRAIADNAFSFVLVAVVVIAIIGVGIAAVGSVRDRLCKADLADFQLFLSGLSEDMRVGSVEEKTLPLPCGAEKVYILDSANPPKDEWFAQYPIMRDSIASKTDKNVFIIKDEKVTHSFSAPRLSLRYPKFTCIIPQSGKVSLLLEGKGGSVVVDPACDSRLCSDIPETFDPKRIGNVFRESDRTNCPGCVDTGVTTLTEEAQKALLLYQNVEIFRRYSYCDGKMTMHLLFRPKDGITARDFRFFETIPKSCIENVEEVLAEMTKPENGVTYVHPDPLLMWGFSTLDSEQQVQYGLEIVLKDECTAAIEGGGVSREVEKNEVALEAVPLSPAMSRQVTLEGSLASPRDQPSQTKPSLAFTSTPPPTGMEKEEYRYGAIVDQAGALFTLTEAPSGMSISQDGEVKWVPAREGSAQVLILAQTTDGQVASQQFTIIVAKKCVKGHERKCSDGDLWSFDSCGKREERVDNCNIVQRCKSGKCCIIC